MPDSTTGASESAVQRRGAVPRVLALLVGLALAACGGSSREAPPGPDPTPIPTTTGQATPSQATPVPTEPSPAGELDPSFGAGGIAIIRVGENVGVGRRGLYVSADGRTSLLAFASDDGGLSSEILRIDLPADGRGEDVTLSRPLPSLRAVAVSFVSDGGAVVLGEREDESGVVAARLTPAGDLDKTFGDRGFAATALESATDVLPLSDGRFVAMGVRDRETVIARLTASGALDRSFGRDGVAPLPRPLGSDREKYYASTDIGGLSDDRLIVAVNFIDSIAVGARLLALTSTGELDRAYGDEGTVTEFPGSSGRVLAASDGVVGWLVNGALRLVSVDGKAVTAVVSRGAKGAPRFDALDEISARGFVLAGYDLVPDEPRRFECSPFPGPTCLRYAFAVQNVTAEGALDDAFGAGGTASTDLPAPYGAGDGARAIVAAPEGRLTVAGHACSVTHCDVALLRYRAP